MLSIKFKLELCPSQQKIFIEYIMFDGVTDEEQHAHLLGAKVGKLLETFQVPICALRTFLGIIRLFGGVLMQGQLEKEAKRWKIIVSKFRNFSWSQTFQFYKSIPSK